MGRGRGGEGGSRKMCLSVYECLVEDAILNQGSRIMNVSKVRKFVME